MSCGGGHIGFQMNITKKNTSEAVNQWKTDNIKVKKDKHDSWQNTPQKTKDWATWAPLKSGSEHRCTWRLSSFCPIVAPATVITVTVKR